MNYKASVWYRTRLSPARSFRQQIISGLVECASDFQKFALEVVGASRETSEISESSSAGSITSTGGQKVWARIFAKLKSRPFRRKRVGVGPAPEIPKVLQLFSFDI